MVERSDLVEGRARVSVGLVLLMAFLGIISITSLGVAWHGSNQLRGAQQAMENRMTMAEQNNMHQIAIFEESFTRAQSGKSALQSDLGVIEKRLRVTQDDLKKARMEDVEKLTQMDNDVKTQLATKASSDDLKAISGNVSGVKADLEVTQTDLKMTRSELGTLIARNHEEIDLLRQTGDRNYFEFAIQGRNKPQKIGDITVELHSVNSKKNQFNVVLVLDDVRTENKNHAVNEPIIFYPRGSRQANEFVVNQLGKDKITGYVSMPKNPVSAAAALHN